MSSSAVSWALRQPVPHSPAKFVLVVMAECVNGGTFLAWPSISHLAEATGQDRKTVMANLQRLKEMGWIEDTGERMGTTKQVVVYRLKEPEKKPENGTVKESQKRNSSESGTVPNFPGNSTNFSPKESQFSPETVPKLVPGTVRTGNRNRKGTRKKEKMAIELPDWLPAEAWAMWDRFRRCKSSKAWTDDAKALSIRTLTTLRDQGYDPVAVIERSIERGWTGLFALDDGRRKQVSGGSRHGDFARQDYHAGVTEDGLF